MFVSRHYRRRGVGRLLLRSLIERFLAQPGIDTTRLWVGEGQHPARRLYEAIGFRVVGVERDSRGDELIMELRVGRSGAGG